VRVIFTLKRENAGGGGRGGRNKRRGRPSPHNIGCPPEGGKGGLRGRKRSEPAVTFTTRAQKKRGERLRKRERGGNEPAASLKLYCFWRWKRGEGGKERECLGGERKREGKGGDRHKTPFSSFFAGCREEARKKKSQGGK